MLNIQDTALLVIDVQGKLAQLMHDKDTLFANLERMIRGAQVLELPVIWTEQVPDKLGATTPAIAQLLADSARPVSKSSFSCCGEAAFTEQLQAAGRKQILVTGIETHICVYQTSVDLLAQGYQVQLVTDAVSSRSAANRQLGIERIKDAGATLTSTEMALFELLRVAQGPQFKAITKIVK
ncbi:MAG: hydrolase [Chloroflexi bacterium]|nr:MAG: hydrolase [Chloroflexota bacterium]